MMPLHNHSGEVSTSEVDFSHEVGRHGCGTLPARQVSTNVSRRVTCMYPTVLHAECNLEILSCNEA